jgi:transposase
MSKQQRRSYDKAFKQMAVELYLKGKAGADVAKDLGIGVDMVRRWAREHSKNGSRSFPGMENTICPQSKRRYRL